MKAALAWVVGSILALAIIVGLIIGGQRFGWWLQTYDVNKGAEVYQQGYGAQSADIQRLNTLMAEVATIAAQIASPQTPANELAALQAQKAAEINQACGVYQLITSPSQTAQTWAAENCS